MPAIELVIFDCEGVLVDSEMIAARAQAELLSAAGHAIEPQEFARLYAGQPFKDILLRIEQETRHVFQASLIAEAEALVERRLEAEATATAGVKAAVEALEVPICVCSDSPKARIEALLARAGLLPLFKDRIFSSREMPSRKPAPAPDLFLAAAEAMEAEPASSFVVEDSVRGVAGAKAAGMRVVGFAGGAHSFPGHADLLTEAGAETVIRRWADLGAVLDALELWSENGAP